MTNIVRNATRVLRGVFILRLFIVVFGIGVFLTQTPQESFAPPPRADLLPLLPAAILAAILFVGMTFFLFCPGLEKRIGRHYLPAALAMSILAFGLESGFAYIRPSAHIFVTLPSGTTISVFRASAETIIMLLIPGVLAGTAYGVRGAVRAAILSSTLHLLLGIVVWLYALPLSSFLALLPLRVAALYGFPLIAGYLSDTWRREHVAVLAANRQLRGYAATIEHLAAFRERMRLSRDMHDTLAHSLSALVVQLEAVDALQEGDPAAARKQLDKVREQAREGLAEARRAILNLRAAPVEELGLAGAIARLVEQFGQRNGVQTTWTVEGESAPLLPAQANALYRIAQEALSNAERHAQANRLAVRLSYGEGVTLCVQDDGLGFDPASVDANRYGLVGIRERAALIDARVTVASAPGAGTTLTVQIIEPWA